MREKSLAAMFLMLVGCGGGEVMDAESENTAPAPTVEQMQSEIVGGTETTGTPAVLALYGTVEGKEGGALCTATLVSPSVLLTAAHCVHPDTAGAGAKFVVFRGHDITDPANRGDPLPVKSVHYHSKWSQSNLQAGFDIAVAVLQDPITDIEPMPFNVDPLTADLNGQPARIIGYGLNNGFGQTGAGVKREALIKLNSFDAQFVKTGSWFGKTICSGDSGGPILMNIGGVETVVGVNSFGFIFCLGEASSTRVDANLDFVDQYVPAQF